jgi:uncharacterized protein
MRALLSALLAGVIFGVGLCVSGMTDPKNVIAFLDVTGGWSPKLFGVMIGAIVVHAVWLRWSARGAVSNSFSPPTRIDGALLLGAALFGVGWGLSGYCPGPALVALGTGALAPVVFVAAMVVGMVLSEAVNRAARNARPERSVPGRAARQSSMRSS